MEKSEKPYQLPPSAFVSPSPFIVPEPSRNEPRPEPKKVKAPVHMWHGDKPVFCHLCGNPLSRGGKFIDGCTTRGSWAIMCVPCHWIDGDGLGTGKGQMYSLKTLKKIRG